MDKALSQEIAQLVLQGLWASRAEFLAGLGVWALISGACAFFGAYLAKLAEGRVADSRFAVLNAQLAETTKTVQRIQTEMAHGEWAQREWKSIRQRKLEELLVEVGAIEAFLDVYRNRIVENSIMENPSAPLDKFQALLNLYFPELKAAGEEFAFQSREAAITLHKASLAIAIALDQGRPQDHLQIYNQHAKEIMDARKQVILGRKSLHLASVQVMRAIFDVPGGS